MKMEGPEGIHPETLKETPPVFISSLYQHVIGFVAENGWYVILCVATCVFLWSKFRPYLEEWQEERERRHEAALHSKNPDLHYDRQLAMEIARQRMQIQHDKLAEHAAEQAKQREEVRRHERLARLQGEGGHRLNSSSTPATLSNSANTLRPGSNPLMGDTSSGSYRPSRRSCPGGGCG